MLMSIANIVMTITMLESYLLVGKHGGINVLQTGEDRTDNLLHCLAGDTLQQLPLGPSLLHDAEAGTDDRADVAVGQRRRRAAAHAGEQHLQDSCQDGLLGRRVGDLEAAGRDGVDDGAHGLGDAGRAGPNEVEGKDLVQGRERSARDGRPGLVGADDVKEGAEVEERLYARPAAVAPRGGAAAEGLEPRDKRVVEVLVVARAAVAAAVADARPADVAAHDGEHRGDLGSQHARHRQAWRLGARSHPRVGFGTRARRRRCPEPAHGSERARGVGRSGCSYDCVGIWELGSEREHVEIWSGLVYGEPRAGSGRTPTQSCGLLLIPLPPPTHTQNFLFD
jgi:hypothetical protein